MLPQKSTFLNIDEDESLKINIDSEKNDEIYNTHERDDECKLNHEIREEHEELDKHVLEEEYDDIHNEINELRPYVGMEFESPDEAYNFYNQYAFKMGFSVRKSSTSKSNRTNKTIGRKYCCSLQGLCNSNTSDNFKDKKKNRCETRTDCKAMIFIRLRAESKWEVSQFVEKHNHNLVPHSKIHKLRSHRKITEGQGVLLNNMRSAGMKTNLVMNYMAREAGGIRNVGFTERDARNFFNAKRKKEHGKSDAEALLDYFERQHMENPSFFYSIQVNSESQITNFFWTDARSRMDYHYFGDVVCFDPTYGTNRYDMPFVPIVGINHHYQTILFGGALLYNESEESFVWVMETWMRSMNGKQPKVILTDQESAIGGAIAKVLPGTRHRYCLWHICRNAMKNLPHIINDHKSFTRDFNNCLYGNETIEEFHSNWEAMLKKYSLENNNWLTRLFQKKEKWASVYTRDIFCAAMYTTQRSESINSFFDGYLKKSLPLAEFIKEYERAVLARREAENDEDYETNHKIRVLRFYINIEKQAAEIYTRTIFQKFQSQLFEGISYRHELVGREGTKSRYLLWRSEYKQATRMVIFDSLDMTTSCSCQLLEFAGYFCRHVLKIFLVEDVQSIPIQYILKRWTRYAKYGPVIDEKGKEVIGDLNESVAIRYSKLCQEAINIAAKGATSIELYKVTMNSLHNALKEVECAMKNEITNISKENMTNNSSKEKMQLLEPPIVKHKGRRKRIKSWMDQLPKKNVVQSVKKKSKGVARSSHGMQTITKKIPHITKEEEKSEIFQHPISGNDRHILSSTIGDIFMSQGPYVVDTYAVNKKKKILLPDLNEDLPPETKDDTSQWDMDLISLYSDIDKDSGQLFSCHNLNTKKTDYVSQNLTLKDVSDEWVLESLLSELGVKVKQHVIERLEDVLGDGHCGYRCCAELLDLDKEDGWVIVRKKMLETLKEDEVLFFEHLGVDQYIYIREALDYYEEYCGKGHWFTLPDMGCLFATTFNCVLCVLSETQNVTYPPLRGGIPEEPKIIAIVISETKNHFVKAILKENAPIPHIYIGWHRYCLPCAFEWAHWVGPKSEAWNSLVAN